VTEPVRIRRNPSAHDHSKDEEGSVLRPKVLYIPDETYGSVDVGNIEPSALQQILQQIQKEMGTFSSRNNLKTLHDVLGWADVAGVRTLEQRLGYQTSGSIEADLSAILSRIGDPTGHTLDNIVAKLGNLSADLATLLGTPTTSIAGDIADLITRPKGLNEIFDRQTGYYYGKNLALGKSYAKSETPHVSYPDTNDSESTDGTLAGLYADGRSYGYYLPNYAGNELTLNVDIDLEETLWVNVARFHTEATVAYKPMIMRIYTSLDGSSWTLRSTIDKSSATYNDRWLVAVFKPVKARYVRFQFYASYSGWHGDWLFIDECEVYFINPDQLRPDIVFKGEVIKDPPAGLSNPIVICSFYLVDRRKGLLNPQEFYNGMIDIMRYRPGADANWTYVITGAPLSYNANGWLYYEYDFPSASWQSGDLVRIIWRGTEIYGGKFPVKIPEHSYFTKVA